MLFSPLLFFSSTYEFSLKQNHSLDYTVQVRSQTKPGALIGGITDLKDLNTINYDQDFV